MQRDSTETEKEVVKREEKKSGEVLCGEMDSDSGDQSEGEISPGKGSVLSFSSFFVSQTLFTAVWQCRQAQARVATFLINTFNIHHRTHLPRRA